MSRSATSDGWGRVTIVQRTQALHDVELDATDPERRPAPGVLDPALAVDLGSVSTSRLGRKRRTSQSPAGWSAAPARRLAVVSTSTASASTNLPAGIVHSIARLESSVASAKNSPRPGGAAAAATSVTGRPSHADSASSVAGAPAPGRGAVRQREPSSPSASSVASASSRSGQRRPVRTRPVVASRTPHSRSPRARPARRRRARPARPGATSRDGARRRSRARQPSTVAPGAHE